MQDDHERRDFAGLASGSQRLLQDEPLATAIAAQTLLPVLTTGQTSDVAVGTGRRK